MKLEHILPQSYFRLNSKSIIESSQTLSSTKDQKSSTTLKIAIAVAAALVRGSIYYVSESGGQYLGLSKSLSRGVSFTGSVVAGVLTENFLNTLAEKSTGIKLPSEMDSMEKAKSYNLSQWGIAITSGLALAILKIRLQLSQTATEAILIGALPVIRELQKTVETP